MPVAVQHAPPPPAPPAITRPYQPFGSALEVLRCRDDEVVLSGPAGTGKSRACLEKVYAIAGKYAGCRILIVRKTRESLTESALVTWEEKVVPPGHPCLTAIQRRTRQSYVFPNGSVVNVGGLDKPTRIMSTEYDLIYVQEAIELTEEDWESLTTRLRNGMVPYQQIIADTNPEGPNHWLKQRAERGQLRMVECLHEDNPTLWDRVKRAWTERGVKYIAKLEALTGVRKDRLRWGRWVAADGLVYDTWQDAVHRIYRSALPAGWEAWDRYWTVDFGFNNAFVWQEWVADPDGRLYRVREIYKTRTLVEDHAKAILALTGRRMRYDRDGTPTGILDTLRNDPDPLPRAIICDHDSEDRATLERHLGMETIAANKAVKAGIQAVQARLRPVPDGHPDAKPRLFLVRDALVERDPELDDKKIPASTEEEIGSYVWAKNKSGVQASEKEEPVKKWDHGLDCTRYMVAYFDEIGVTDSGQVAWDVF